MTTPPSFPSLPGLGFSVHKKPTNSSRVATHVSGRDVRVPLYTYRLWEFELTIEGLDSGGVFSGLGLNSLQTLMGFHGLCLGQANPFLFTDPTDNSVTAQDLGEGDGTTTDFTFLRTQGGYVVDPVGWVTSVTNVYFNGVAIPQAGWSAPSAPGLSETSGGSLGAQTCYCTVTYVTPSGETVASSESSLNVDANNLLVVASPAASAPAGATGWNVYVGASSGAEVLQNSSPIAIGTPWTEPTTGLLTGTATPPATNTTGWSLEAPNTLAFAAAPGAGVLISGDFDFAFQCRFLDDQLDFEQFMSGLWTVASVKFRSVKP
jgi:hypothetical protein